jgi:hypothetical protein
MVRSSSFCDWISTASSLGRQQVAPRKKLWKRSTAVQLSEKLWYCEEDEPGFVAGNARTTAAAAVRRRVKERILVAGDHGCEEIVEGANRVVVMRLCECVVGCGEMWSGGRWVFSIVAIDISLKKLRVEPDGRVFLPVAARGLQTDDATAVTRETWGTRLSLEDTTQANN